MHHLVILLWKALVILVLFVPRSIAKRRVPELVARLAEDEGLSWSVGGEARGSDTGNAVRLRAHVDLVDPYLRLTPLVTELEVETALPGRSSALPGTASRLRQIALGAAPARSSSGLRVDETELLELELAAHHGALDVLSRGAGLRDRALYAVCADREGTREAMHRALRESARAIRHALEDLPAAAARCFRTAPDRYAALYGRLAARSPDLALALRAEAVAWADRHGNAPHLVELLGAVNDADAAEYVGRILGSRFCEESIQLRALRTTVERGLHLDGEALTAGAVSSSPAVRAVTMAALPASWKETTRTLVEALEDHEVEVQVAAASRLGEVGSLPDVEVLRAASAGLTTSRPLKRACEAGVALIQARRGGAPGTLQLVDEGGALALADAAIE